MRRCRCKKSFFCFILAKKFGYIYFFKTNKEAVLEILCNIDVSEAGQYLWVKIPYGPSFAARTGWGPS